VTINAPKRTTATSFLLETIHTTRPAAAKFEAPMSETSLRHKGRGIQSKPITPF
jgi:hypothetical protein